MNLRRVCRRTSRPAHQRALQMGCGLPAAGHGRGAPFVCPVTAGPAVASRSGDCGGNGVGVGRDMRGISPKSEPEVSSLSTGLCKLSLGWLNVHSRAPGRVTPRLWTITPSAMTPPAPPPAGFRVLSYVLIRLLLLPISPVSALSC